MAKRLLDIILSFIGLVIISPIFVLFVILIWLYDFHNPFYVASRVEIDGKLFLMVKLRSMLVDADKLGVDSTAANDSRITPIGHFVRRYKLDEFTQLWNVLIGQMSLVGPRPNVERETRLYTKEEKRLLSIRPGITDFSSIVFADEADILEGHVDPDLVYNQLIRPWKSRLSLFYIDNRNILLAIKLIYLTFLSMISRSRALYKVSEELRRRGAPTELVQIALRETALIPHPPPGTNDIVRSRIVD